MHHIRKPFSLATAAVVIFLCERGAEATWPETPAWTWWSLAVVVAVLSVGATCWSEIGKLLRKSRPKTGLIPLIKGIDMAWSRMRDVSALPHVEGKKVFRDLTHQMFNGTDRAVRLYGIRPPCSPQPSSPTRMCTNSRRMAAPYTCSTKTTGWWTSMFTVPM